MNLAELSHQQAGADLAACWAAGNDRTALTATEGLSFVDPTFRARWQQHD